jgi:hypothetical protein
MELSNVSFLKVDVLSVKRIHSICRNGPKEGIVVPKADYVFMANNGYHMNVHQLIKADGSIEDIVPIEINGEGEEKPVEVVVIAKTEPAVAPVAVAEVKEEEPVVSDADDKEEAPADSKEEEKQEAEEEAVPADLLETVQVDGDNIKVRPLTLEQYDTFVKADLLKFLRAVAPSLPEEVAALIESSKADKESKKTLLELIELYIINDEAEGDE